jgi:soluble lytic murein transglycosylase-like protein
VAADPVRELFLESWAQLEPLLGALAELEVADEESLRLASFIAAGDALRVIDALGPQYGIEISRDGLRRLARMLLAGDAPATFTPLPLGPDPQLRELFGFDPEEPAAEAAPAPSASLWRRLSPIPAAYAQEDDPALLLRELQPSLPDIDRYLEVVARLLDRALAQHEADGRMSAEYEALFNPLVRATAWKETCWRHYVRRPEGPEVIRSPVGAVGMMQIVGRVWRSVYDIERLEEDVNYNVAAGIEILEHYFLHYAVRRGEHKQPGGLDNLPRATYAAYNGGPGKLSRYRREDVPARARAVDREFYRHYQAMQQGPWPTDSACYAP